MAATQIKKKCLSTGNAASKHSYFLQNIKYKVTFINSILTELYIEMFTSGPQDPSSIKVYTLRKVLN